jgi:hypothetical protein
MSIHFSAIQITQQKGWGKGLPKVKPFVLKTTEISSGKNREFVLNDKPTRQVSIKVTGQDLITFNHLTKNAKSGEVNLQINIYPDQKPGGSHFKIAVMGPELVDTKTNKRVFGGFTNLFPTMKAEFEQIAQLIDKIPGLQTNRKYELLKHANKQALEKLEA